MRHNSLFSLQLRETARGEAGEFGGGLVAAEAALARVAAGGAVAALGGAEAALRVALKRVTKNGRMEIKKNRIESNFSSFESTNNLPVKFYHDPNTTQL